MGAILRISKIFPGGTIGPYLNNKSSILPPLEYNLYELFSEG